MIFKTLTKRERLAMHLGFRLGFGFGMLAGGAITWLVVIQVVR